jgi:response regulator RpfG family c-di-GMP phosphodiesterase
MMDAQDPEGEMIFAQEPEAAPAGRPARAGWKVMIIDDDPGVHEVTRLALSGFEFDGRSLEFLSAYSAAEGESLLRAHPDTAVALVDVVMEHEHAGLDLVRSIREVQQNRMIRLILRTGQPGQAPERTVIRQYDINDYKEKSELSAQKLYSAILTSLRSWRDLMALDANRAGLQRVIRATGEIFRTRDLSRFVQGVLEQLVALLFLERDALLIQCDSLALRHEGGQVVVVAATGEFVALVGTQAVSSLPTHMLEDVATVLRTRKPLLREGEYWGYFQARSGNENVIYLKSLQPLSGDDSSLIQLFLQNVSIAYENTLLHDEIEGTQRDIVYMLGEAIETRSRETGQHVRRVAEYCHLIARGIGLSERDADILKMAAPLHDFGKIGIPDAVLHKPGKLDEDEWVVMRQHAEIGYEMLGQSKREILQAAALLAGQHQEKGDGMGYPLGLQGEQIHIYGRIGAVADVFDALGSRRCYKEPWPLEATLDYLRQQRGLHFDPAIVDWVLGNVDLMGMVAVNFPDPMH